ncbi:hypothetical protein P9112_007856 [Eukaryota sp. TZLM1-RC]
MILSGHPDLPNWVKKGLLEDDQHLDKVINVRIDQDNAPDWIVSEFNSRDRLKILKKKVAKKVKIKDWVLKLLTDDEREELWQFENDTSICES